MKKASTYPIDSSSFSCKQGHDNQPVISLCFSKECKESKPCCMSCLASNHSTHLNKIVVLDTVGAFLKNYKESKDNYVRLKDMKIELNHLKEDVSKLIVAIEEQIKLNETDFIKEWANKYFEKNKVLTLEDIEQMVTSISFQVEGIDNKIVILGDDYFKAYQEASLTVIKQFTSQINKITDSIKIMSFESYQLEQEKKKQEVQELTQRTLQSNENEQPNLQKEDLIQSEKSIGSDQDKKSQIYDTLQFSSKNKHKDVILVTKFVAKKTSANSQALIYGNKGFNPQTESFSFGFKIINLANNIWIGIGAIKGDEYLIDYNTPHGQYMLSFGKCVFYHNDKSINNSYIGIPFKTGDTIFVTYKQESKIIEFKNNEQSFTLQLQQLDQMLFPVARLYGAGDCVEIINI